MFSNCGRSSGFAHFARRLVNISSTGLMPSGVIQVAEHNEDRSREALKVAGEHPGPAADIGREDHIDGKVDTTDKGAILAYQG
jgi:hypothetical protein